MKLQTGSALTETLIGLMVLLPAFIAMDYLGRLQEIRRDSVELARAASWETTVRPVERAMINPSISLQAGMDRTVDNPLWQMQGTSLISADSTPEIRRYEHVEGNLISSRFVSTSLFAHGRFIPDWVSILGLSGSMLGLPQEITPISAGRISARALIDPVQPEKPLLFESRASLSPNAWVAHSDSEYQQRLQQVGLSELLRVITIPAHTMLGYIPFYKEGRYAKATDFIPESRIHPDSRRYR